MSQRRTLRRFTRDATRVYKGAAAVAGTLFYYAFVPAVVLAGLTTIEGGLTAALSGAPPAPQAAA